MRKRRGLVIVFFILIIVTATGCGNSDEDKARDVIAKYNYSLPLAYMGSTDILRPVATDRVQGGVDIFKTQLADQKKVIEARLISLNIKGISFTNPVKKDDGSKKNMGDNYKHRKEVQVIDPDKLPQALAQVHEIWEYRYLDIKSRKPLNKWEKIKYKAKYTLLKIEEEWFVNDLVFEEEIMS